MKKLIALSALMIVAASFNVGCKASGSIGRNDTRQLKTTAQVAYVSAPEHK